MEERNNEESRSNRVRVNRYLRCCVIKLFDLSYDLQLELSIVKFNHQVTELKKINRKGCLFELEDNVLVEN